MVYIICNFLVLHFGEIFMKIETKIPKLQMHGNSHRNVCFHSHFYANFMMVNLSNKYVTALLYMVFNPFKMVVQFF